MAGQEFQYIEDILKEFYAPAIVNQVYKKAPLWAQVEKLVSSVYGKQVTIPIQTAFTEAVGGRVANDYSLPTAQKNSYDQTTLRMKRLYGRIQVDGFSIDSAKGKGGWVDIMSAETKGVANAFAIDMDRQSMGRGDSVIGEIASVDGAQTLTVDNPLGITLATPGFNWFRVGQVVDIWNPLTAARCTTRTISDVTGNVLTLTGGVVNGNSEADNDTIHRTLVMSATVANIGEIMGIDGIVDSGHPIGTTFQGVSRTGTGSAFWQAYETATATVISETAIQEVLDAIDNRTDGEPVDLLLTTNALRNKLIDILRQDRQISTMDLKGGWKALKYVGGPMGEIPIMTHKFCPTGYMYFLALPHLKFYTLSKLVWDNKGGGIVKPVAGYDAYESWFKMYCNMGTDCCNSMGKHTGLTTA
jgi:hypothetical protein